MRRLHEGFENLFDGTFDRTPQTALRLSTYQTQSSLQHGKIASESEKEGQGSGGGLGHSHASERLRVMTGRSAASILMDTSPRAVTVAMSDGTDYGVLGAFSMAVDAQGSIF